VRLGIEAVTGDGVPAQVSRTIEIPAVGSGDRSGSRDRAGSSRGCGTGARRVGCRRTACPVMVRCGAAARGPAFLRKNRAPGKLTGSSGRRRSDDASAALSTSQPPSTSAACSRATVSRWAARVKYMITLRQRIRSIALVFVASDG